MEYQNPIASQRNFKTSNQEAGLKIMQDSIPSPSQNFCDHLCDFYYHAPPRASKMANFLAV